MHALRVSEPLPRPALGAGAQESAGALALSHSVSQSVPGT